MGGVIASTDGMALGVATVKIVFSVAIFFFCFFFMWCPMALHALDVAYVTLGPKCCYATGVLSD